MSANKIITLVVGGPLVALGIRFLFDGIQSHLTMLVFAAAIMLLVGVNVVRFEDLPIAVRRIFPFGR